MQDSPPLATLKAGKADLNNCKKAAESLGDNVVKQAVLKEIGEILNMVVAKIDQYPPCVSLVYRLERASCARLRPQRQDT